jgi:hypothetical protein
MSKTKRASFTKPTLVVAVGVFAALLASACSDDGDTTNPGGGAAAGRGGTGATGGTGGRGGTGGTTATGGTGATTGTGGTTGGPGDSGPDTPDSTPDAPDSAPDSDAEPNDSGPDGSDGGCPTGQVLRYEAPGCNATPRCGLPIQDACLGYACSCRGTLLTGCDYFTEPYSARGTCAEAGLSDSGGG